MHPIPALIETSASPAALMDPFTSLLTIFVMACFVGYYVVWRVTPALHTPLMAVTNAISGIIVVGAIIAVGSGIHWGGSDAGSPLALSHEQDHTNLSAILGFIAIVLASVNIFGGFIVTQRMLQMFRKKEGKR